jgi:hypothetical protein
VSTTLQKHAENLWTASSSLRMAKLFDFPIRMVVVRLSGGGLWLHSPIALDDALVGEIAQLGRVEHIVAPSCYHHVFAGKARERFPDAKFWAAPGLDKKRSDLPATSLEGAGSHPFGGDLEALFVRGAPAINEVVFLHRPSRSLIVTDLFFNIKDARGMAMKMFLRMAGVHNKATQGRIWKMMIKDKPAFVESATTLLSWEFDRILVAHGDPIQQDAHVVAEQAFAWIVPVGERARKTA